MTDCTVRELSNTLNDLQIYGCTVCNAVWSLGQPTEWLYSWLTDWITDFNELWLIDLLTDRLRVYCLIHWLTKILCDWLYCPRADQHTKWFTKSVSGWLTEYLTLLFDDLPTDWIIYRWLIAWLAKSTLQGLTNQLNDLWLVDWLTSCLYCPETNQLTEWFMTGWLTTAVSSWLNCPEIDQLTEQFMAGWFCD